MEGPPRALPWSDVRRVLGAVDRSTALGKRDYAILPLMATYGMGRSEVVQLRLDDIDWSKRTFRFVRRKTRVDVSLPLLDPIARVLACYLRAGRPARTTAREVFLRSLAPHVGLSGNALYSLLPKYAALAGVSAPFLGTHALRHSHACRQVESAAPPKVVSDILGHSNPESISTYVRIATERLRAVCLPVP